MSSDKVPQTILQQATATEITHAVGNKMLFFSFVLAVWQGGSEPHILNYKVIVSQ
jgi:hypothetical protein